MVFVHLVQFLPYSQQNYIVFVHFYILNITKGI